MKRGFVKKFQCQIAEDKKQFYKYVDNVKYLEGKVPYAIAIRLSEDWKTHEATAQMLVDMTQPERNAWVMNNGAQWLRETAMLSYAQRQIGRIPEVFDVM